MSNILKRLTLLAAIIVAVLCAGVFAACGDQGESPTDTTAYNVTVVYPGGTVVNGTTDGLNPFDPDEKFVTVQICVVKADGTTGNCFDKVKLDANGKVSIKAPSYTLQTGEKFKLQVNNVPDGYKCDASRTYYSSANYVTQPGTYTVTLEAA